MKECEEGTRGLIKEISFGPVLNWSLSPPAVLKE